jgi:hypothetical protein
MMEELTRLLRAVPFTPFAIFTRDGEVQPVTNIERLVVGRNVCAYVDQEGYITLFSYAAIDRVVTKNGPEIT